MSSLCCSLRSSCSILKKQSLHLSHKGLAMNRYQAMLYHAGKTLTVKARFLPHIKRNNFLPVTRLSQVRYDCNPSVQESCELFSSRSYGDTERCKTTRKVSPNIDISNFVSHGSILSLPQVRKLSQFASQGGFLSPSSRGMHTRTARSKHVIKEELDTEAQYEKLHQQAHGWTIRLANENGYMSWCRNTYIGTVIAVTVNMQAPMIQYANEASIWSYGQKCIMSKNLDTKKANLPIVIAQSYQRGHSNGERGLN
ncbi:hypothetical protein CAPTEDRAFT_188438 [Capitella teleta]|uniref:Uncharacterized protein n=1 Tax=Capitella teleta TaxID=283909 RepID=R7UCW9_CAPTE|nr:hypothetical protein CAPTEDRAFT_188438 [Capitella teleta]|eukprot:ELU04235.1 hypothetical protein CAPTEDRAFT_188438 [Capitella teleta]